MTVTIDKTTKKYHGRKAETYDAIRKKQERWDLENAAVERMLTDLRPEVVLDCPVGTGRFLQLYAKLSVKEVIGVDASDSMLALAKRKIPRSMKLHAEVQLAVGDARKHQCKDKRVDVTVCVRFLDLIDEDAMRSVMGEMFRVTRKAIILTIRLGDKYVPKSNTATHDRKKFLAIVRRNGWRVAEETPIFNQGWFVMKLERN